MKKSNFFRMPGFRTVMVGVIACLLFAIVGTFGKPLFIETAAVPRQWWIEYDPKINVEDTAKSSQQRISVEDIFTGGVVLERVVDQSTFVTREIVGWTPEHKAVLGREIILRFVDMTGMLDMVIGRKYRIHGRISSKQPFTVTFPIVEGIRPLFSYD